MLITYTREVMEIVPMSIKKHCTNHKIESDDAKKTKTCANE